MISGAGDTSGRTSPARKPRLVMLGGALPQRLAPSAGGEYVTTLAEQLADHFDVTAVAPAHAANVAARNDGRTVVASILLGSGRPSLWSRVLNRIDNVLRRLDLALPSLGVLVALFLPGPLRNAIREADVVDLQWTEFVSLAPAIRRLNPQATIVGTLHDAMTQVAERRPRASVTDKLQHTVGRRITLWHEGFSSGQVDHLRVLNPKDAAIVAALPRSGDPVVIHPPRPQPPRADQPRSGHRVIFVGAFGRTVNQEATEWLLAEIWPRVRHSVPDAHLVLAGSDPAGTAARAAEGRDDVTATGFVDDLTDHYRQAAVVAVPLLNGGGIKFKTIDALLHRLPVITTSVGAEGIDGTDLFWALTDDAVEFADALVSALTSPEASERAIAAGDQVAERYGTETFARSVRETYGSL